MTVNTRFQENPALQRMPKNEREWVQYTNELAKWVRYVVKLGDGSITTSGGTTISGLDEMPGRVPSERSLPMVVVGNKASVQSASTLTASDAGGTATVSIAAHTLKTSTGDVSYNAGSIAGLSFSTLYYVYTDDEDFDGGAVTYQASTDAADAVGDAGRYYLGSITTGIAALSANLSGVTKGTTTTFTTSAAHGFTTGGSVEVDSIVDNGPGGDIESTFNGNTYTITVTDTTNFTVAVDSSSLTNTYASGGTGDQASTSPSGSYGGGGGGESPIAV